MAIPFIDLQTQRRRLGEPLNAAISAAVEGGAWILGPQVTELEKKLAEFAGVKHCIANANGTDALMLILRGWNIGPGDAVFVRTGHGSRWYTETSIRFDQAGFGAQLLLALSRVFARRIIFRMTGVRATLAGLPALISCLYLAFMSGLKRVATRAGM